VPVRISAAASGVPNSAAMVAEVATIMINAVGALDHSRPTSAIASETLMAMIGFSGPRLTPPASDSRTASTRLGTADGGSGSATSSVVAES
jgi:hypothetical protein